MSDKNFIGSIGKAVLNAAKSLGQILVIYESPVCYQCRKPVHPDFEFCSEACTLEYWKKCRDRYHEVSGDLADGFPISSLLFNTYSFSLLQVKGFVDTLGAVSHATKNVGGRMTTVAKHTPKNTRNFRTGDKDNICSSTNLAVVTRVTITMETATTTITRIQEPNQVLCDSVWI